MKVALISYHSNMRNIYPEVWVEQYRDSILAQTYTGVNIYECNYGDSVGVVFFGSTFISKKFPTFVHCMNWMLDWLFNEEGYDVVGNSNLDDVYDPRWLEKAIEKIKEGYDVVSCNFRLFNDGGIYHSHHFDGLDIEKELERNHNVVCHPAVVFHRRFHERGNRYNPDEIPYEDRELWKRAIKNSKFTILPEHLLLHRVHSNSVCQSENR